MIYPQVSRIEPQFPAWAYKTYRILSPPSHRRKASCEEVECERWRRGWKTCLDVADTKHAEAANWIRLHSGLRFDVHEQGTAVTFTFPAGQSCWAAHTVPFKPHLFLVHGGDWRGNPRGVPVVRHSGAQSWADDFGENQLLIRERIGRG
jgi:hypothetical protein